MSLSFSLFKADSGFVALLSQVISVGRRRFVSTLAEEHIGGREERRREERASSSVSHPFPFLSQVKCDGASKDNGICTNCATLDLDCTYVEVAKKYVPSLAAERGLGRPISVTPSRHRVHPSPTRFTDETLSPAFFPHHRRGPVSLNCFSLSFLSRSKAD